MDYFREYLDAILDGVTLSKTRRQELEEEITDHLNMLKEEFMAQDYTEEEAEVLAMDRFGDTEELKENLKKVHTFYFRLKESINTKKIVKETLQWSAIFLFSIIISLSIKSYGFAQTEVQQSSMQNTLYEGQRLIENKLEYYYSKPQRGEIVIINTTSKKGGGKELLACTKDFLTSFQKDPQEDDGRLVKRVIGIPGDTIDIIDGKVSINGEIYEEPYVTSETDPHSMEFPITIPKDEYFVLGDNRSVSMDSRDIGLIDIANIEGRAVLRVWPFDKIGPLK